MNTKTYKTSSVLSFFLNYVGNSLIGLTILTDARAKKTNNPYITGKEIILKKTRLLANIGFHYSNSLESQAKREGKEIDFDIKPRRWGIRLPNCALVEHKGNHYLECKVEKTFEVNYFLMNGAPIEKSAIQEFLPKKKESATQDELDKKVILRDVKLENILSMRIQGEEIILD
jgi:hypothetical protein